MNKTWRPQEIYWGFKENLILPSPFHATVPRSVQEKVLAELKKMKAGRDDSFLGPIKDQQGKVIVQADQRVTDKELLTIHPGGVRSGIGDARHRSDRLSRPADHRGGRGALRSVADPQA